VAERRVAVIGGGISGLAAAHALIDAGADVSLFESAPVLGGKIAATRLAGLELPTAPDAFLARQPEMIELAEQLGLGHQLVAPVARAARIARNGQLHPLPPNLLGIPTDLDALAKSDLISDAGVARAAQDLDAADDRPAGDESVGALVRRRLGDEVLEYLVDPLLGGINAGDSDRLSALAGVPQVGAARALHPSLIEAVRLMRSRATPDPDAPVFLAPVGGLQMMIGALQQRVASHGQLRLGEPASIELTNGNGWSVNGNRFDRVVVATAAQPAAALVERLSPTTADELRRIEASSVAMVLFVLPAGCLALDDSISGVLVPRLEGRVVTAISVATHKWPHLAPDATVLRVSAGRRTDERWQTMTDAELITAVRSDLAQVIDLQTEPTATHVTRWMHALPQYDVDHAGRIDRLEAALRDDAPGLHLAGPMLRGLGLPACVRSGRTAAAAALG
jgi:oxygen-dependent protoporphyrinogen oxidase